MNYGYVQKYKYTKNLKKSFVVIDFHERARLPAVVVVLGDAGGDGEDVGVEDDVARVEADAVHQYVVGAHADAHLAVLVHGLESKRNIRRKIQVFHFFARKPTIIF